MTTSDKGDKEGTDHPGKSDSQWRLIILLVALSVITPRACNYLAMQRVKEDIQELVDSGRMPGTKSYKDPFFERYSSNKPAEPLAASPSAWQRLPGPCRSFLSSIDIGPDHWVSGELGSESRAVAGLLAAGVEVNGRLKNYAVTVHNGIWREVGLIDGTKSEGELAYRSMTLFQGLSLCDILRDKGNGTLAQDIEADLWDYEKKELWRTAGRIGR
jgi:hypothetical protein